MVPQADIANAEIVRRAFERWNTDRATFIEIVDAEVEIDVQSSQVTGGVPFRGHDGFRRWVATMEESFDVWELHCQSFEEYGDAVLALGMLCVRGRGSGLHLDQEMGWIVDLKDGKLRRLRSYQSHAEARDAFERER
jgi:ketosteroid isomerase-like protein